MKTRAFIYIILTGVLWGTSGLFVNALAPFGFSAMQMTAMRAVVPAVCITVYALIRDRSLFKVKAAELALFCCSGFAIFGTASCYFSSIQLSSVSTAVVLMYTAPVFVMAFSVAYLGEKLTRIKILSVVCMIVGCALVSGIIGGLKFSISGIALGLLSGIAYSAYNIFTKIEMRRNCNPLSATLYCFIFMSIISLAVSNAGQMVTLTLQNPTKTLPLIIAIGVLTSIIPYFLYTLALREVPVGTASALSIVEPMAATIFSVTLLGERIGISSVCGIILILSAVFLLSRSEN